MSGLVLDRERFAKVLALQDGTTVAGERAAAADRLAAMARAAGLTVEQAVASLAAAPAGDCDFLDELDELFEEVAACPATAGQDDERRAKTAAIIERYGSREALFADTPLEAAMRAAVRQLPAVGREWLRAWDGYGSTGAMPPCVRGAMNGPLFPLPATVSAAWFEYAAVDRRQRDRASVDALHEGSSVSYARQALVGEMLNTLPSRSLKDVRARLSWLDHWAESDWRQDGDDYRATLNTLRADVERMASRIPRDPVP